MASQPELEVVPLECCLCDPGVITKSAHVVPNSSVRSTKLWESKELYVKNSGNAFSKVQSGRILVGIMK